MAIEEKDSLKKLCTIIINEHLFDRENENHGYIINSWLKLLYIKLLEPYGLTPSNFINYNFYLAHDELWSYEDKNILEYYINESDRYFRIMPEVIINRFENMNEINLENLRNYYIKEEGFNQEQWFLMKTKILEKKDEIRIEIEEIPLKFMQALQLQYLFAIGVLPLDFIDRLEKLTEQSMLFESVIKGGAQNYVLFKGFVKKMPSIAQRILLRKFCDLINFIIDGENEYRRLEIICDKLIQQVINGIAYSRAIVRNTENEILQYSNYIIQAPLIENIDKFPFINENYYVDSEWIRIPGTKEKAKMKVLKPKKELTEDQRIHVAKQFAKNLEKILGTEIDQDIKITKNQPKKTNLDAGFMEN